MLQKLYIQSRVFCKYFKCEKQITLEELKDVRFIKNHQKKFFSLHRTKFSENSDFLVNQ